MTSSRPIADYALLSDCHSAILVSSDASIDWACLRSFDRPSTFAHLLDTERGGRYHVVLDDPVVTRRRRYLPGTMVLETELETNRGVLRVTDALAMRAGGAHDPRGQLVRRFTGVQGVVGFDVVIEPRFDYGAARPWLRPVSPHRVVAVAGDDGLIVDADVELAVDRDQGRIVVSFDLTEGRTSSIVSTSRPAHLVRPDAEPVPDPDALLDETIGWWTAWSERTRATGPHAELLSRSALVLKSLCCAPTGAIIAAPTTSLPEIEGGAANWDYRYCWVRDATLTLQSLSEVDHHEVAGGFRDFLMRSSAGRGEDLQIMYGVHGERRLPELELDLAGWRDSRPVRIGNGAVSQTQLDVYGHLLDAAHLWHARTGTIDDDEWRFLSSVVDHACRVRHSPDAGIWELRGAHRHHVHSKVMIWVALDRGIRLVDDHGLSDAHGEVEEWRASAEEIRAEIAERGVRDGHFVSHYDTVEVDASLLKLPLVGFVAADDPRMVATVDAIQRDLAVAPSGMLRRFRGDADMEAFATGTEGVFLLCSLWLVEVLAMQGRADDATALLDEIVAAGNDLGLFAEEFDPDRGELLGNFPQAFTHLGLIAAVSRLAGPERGGR